MSNSRKVMRVYRAAMRLYKLHPFSVLRFEMKRHVNTFYATGKVWYREGYANELMQACAAALKKGKR